MRFAEENDISRAGRPPQYNPTFRKPSLEWAVAYQDNPELKSLTETEALTPDPSPNNIWSENELRDQLRKMTYLRLRAAEGSQEALRQAWQIRDAIIGNLFSDLVGIIESIQAEFPDQTYEKLFEPGLNELYRQVDERNYFITAQPRAFTLRRVFDYLKSRIVPRKSTEFKELTGVPETLSHAESSVQSEPLDMDAARTFLDRLFQKLRDNGNEYAHELIRCFTENLTIPQIARERGVTSPAVVQGLHRALGSIRNILLHDPELVTLAADLGFGVEDQEDVRLLIARVVDRFRSGTHQKRRRIERHKNTRL